MKGRCIVISFFVVIAVGLGWFWMTRLRKSPPAFEQAAVAYPPVDDAVWLNLNRRDSMKYREQLRETPPAIIVRSTHYTFSPTNGVGFHYGWIDGRLVNLVVGFSELVSYGYSTDATFDSTLMARAEMPDAWINGHLPDKFDVIFTATNQPKEVLQAEVRKLLKSQYNLSWHRDRKDTEVLVIRTKDTALLESKATDVFSESKSIPELVSELENYFSKPVMDETGATKRYDKSLELVPSRWANGRTTDLSANNQFLAGYGLELVVTNQSTEQLILDR